MSIGGRAGLALWTQCLLRGPNQAVVSLLPWGARLRALVHSCDRRNDLPDDVCPVTGTAVRQAADQFCAQAPGCRWRTAVVVTRRSLWTSAPARSGVRVERVEHGLCAPGHIAGLVVLVGLQNAPADQRVDVSVHVLGAAEDLPSLRG